MIKIDKIVVVGGVAGQVAADVYAGDNMPTSFVGNVYGGPVAMLWNGEMVTYVDSPERFGDFGADPEAWVRRFYTD